MSVIAVEELTGVFIEERLGVVGYRQGQCASTRDVGRVHSNHFHSHSLGLNRGLVDNCK